MSKISTEKFLEMVEMSGLIEQVTLNRLLEKVRAKCEGQLPSDANKLATLFRKQGLLTQWHLDKLLVGKYKGFFLGKYKLLGHIGSGGMSSVYLAEHMRLGDKRAIKVLPKKRVHDATYLARFQLEAKAIASLNHPNIVLAYDIDNEGDVHYIVMEYVDGIDLLMLVKRDGPLDFSTAADLIAQAARGLDHAHSKGVVHRDVKPANLLLDLNGSVRLLDMGLALVASGDEESLTVANNENVLGTADYLAPEQALNSHTVDHRADIYGLGCTFYYLLTGQPPFNDGTLAQRIAKHQTEMPQSIRQLRPECPGELEGICVKMIQKDPKYRYQHAGEVAEVLERFVARVPKGQKVTSGLGESPVFDDDSGSSSIGFDDSGISASQGDTISNKSGDTISSSRAKLLQSEGISSSDSGRLVNVRPRPDLVGGSFIDLQAESGYRPNSGISTPQGDSGSEFARFPPASSGRSSVHVGGDSDIYNASGSRIGNGSGRSTGASRRKNETSVDPLLLGALAFALFVVAIAIGFYLARMTST
ncbi:Serine/threonine-protein kinase PrkC [Novipirellula galeiformis]|uniref:Serine/threonine-protein kinase PrkC n=1 Tax=Novipirellula galeiformis TaxID=2528004 RepID=A0A5C6CSP7_9BACT|nr:serine/threonine-protein kinase [Novipirellula galeiformis]TWU26567.1 Serine/threonine-protein kinase PrkC [Novipirellula galeiformis]